MPLESAAPALRLITGRRHTAETILDAWRAGKSPHTMRSYEQDLDHRTPGFRSGFDAAAEWLLAHAPDPPGGAWAAETVRALGAAAYE